MSTKNLVEANRCIDDHIQLVSMYMYAVFCHFCMPLLTTSTFQSCLFEKYRCSKNAAMYIGTFVRYVVFTRLNAKVKSVILFSGCARANKNSVIAYIVTIKSEPCFSE